MLKIGFLASLYCNHYITSPIKNFSSSYIYFFNNLFFRLVYDSTTKQMIAPPGVNVRVPFFGNTTGIKYLDPSVSHPGEYFAALVAALQSAGFEDGVSLRGAPYDFRRAPSKQ